MSSVLAYSTATPAKPAIVGAAEAMRNVAAAAKAAVRIEAGVKAHDRLYGSWICLCPCRRCVPTKSDCGGCVYLQCEREFVSHSSAATFYSSYGMGYDRRGGGPTYT